uniref:Uncharacterized protein n=1 Tax=Arundo donax TaxID=35708 RepID=A0A0A9E451_ARUDO
MIRFASCANSCRGSTFELKSSLALLTIVAASDDIAKLRRSSNSSSETSPISSCVTDLVILFPSRVSWSSI